MSNYSVKQLFYYFRIFCLLALIFHFNCHCATARRGRDILINLPRFPKPSDPNSTEVSPVAIQIAGILGIESDLRRFEQLRTNLASTTSSKTDLEARQELTDLKLEMISAIEQARLDIDFVVAEMEDEHVRLLELYQAGNDEQQKRINRANINAFRTNGVLWAVAEGLSIPTYKHPMYSIPSGTVGIIAGIVPSVFSLYAMHPPTEYYKHSSYPNMLCKIFDYPTIPRTEYPNSVWAFLNAKPIGEPTRSRREILIEHWLADKNIHTLKKRDDRDRLDSLTGTKQSLVSPDELSDRLLMLRETNSIVLQINRPLMELMMLIRGQKQF